MANTVEGYKVVRVLDWDTSPLIKMKERVVLTSAIIHHEKLMVVYRPYRIARPILRRSRLLAFSTEASAISWAWWLSDQNYGMKYRVYQATLYNPKDVEDLVSISLLTPENCYDLWAHRKFTWGVHTRAPYQTISCTALTLRTRVAEKWNITRLPDF